MSGPPPSRFDRDHDHDHDRDHDRDRDPDHDHDHDHDRDPDPPLVPSRAVERAAAPFRLASGADMLATLMGRWVGALGLVAVVAAIAGIFACRQIVGITDNPPEALTSTLCGLPYGTNSCASCVNANCCTQSTACAADPIFCAPYESCLGACNGDPGCRSKCTIDYPVPADNAAPVSALSACLASKCETACGLTCGGFAGYLSMPDAAAGCASCLEKNACTHARSCGTSEGCDAFWRCYLACQTPDCQWACARDNDGGAGLFRPLYQDFSSSTCATQCGYGSYWACARHVKWPNAKSANLSYTWWAYDFQSGLGVAGAQVSVCVNGTGPGCPCSAPGSRMLAQGQTDANGYITLSSQQDLTPTGGGSTACVETQAPGYLSNFTTFASPAVEPVWSISDALVPRQAMGIVLQTQAAQQTYYSLLNLTFDPTVASVLGVGVFDCLGSPAPGVDVYASIGGTPVPDAGADAIGTAVFTDSGVTGGTSNGPGGRMVFFDVPFGNVAVTAIVPGVGIVGQTSATTAANTLTQVGLPPTQ